MSPKVGRAFVSCVSFVVLLAAPAAAQQPSQDAYTFVAEWSVGREKSADLSAWLDEGLRPVAERLVADGTLTGFGQFETVVHTETNPTHGIWFSSNSIAAIEKARIEALKVPPSPVLAGAKHQDHFLRLLLSRSKPTSGPGYLRANIILTRPGRGAAWRALFDKHFKPVWDELAASGAITGYSVFAQYISTNDPGIRMVVFTAANAEASTSTAWLSQPRRRSAPKTSGPRAPARSRT